MPQYRIEISPNNRAGCKDTVCKKEGVKITKGEIRFGTWVEIEGRGSWSWKHWGCVSGEQMQRLHEQCDKGDDEWDFDEIDGFDELDSNPDVQGKVRRCVKQAHIDAEDFKGDPEKNKPGEKGIRLSAKERAALAKNDDEDDEPKAKKRGRGAAKAKPKGTKSKTEDEDDDENDEPPAKRAKAAPAKRGRKPKVVDDDSDDAPITKAKPAAAKRSKKAKAGENSGEEEVSPATKAKATTKKAPAKGRKAKPVDADDEDEDEEEEKPKPKRRGRPSTANA